jgi:potassium channel subfamily K, other eukaryote
MHIKAFDKAVRRYRQRVQHVKPVSGSSGRHFRLWGRTRTQADPHPPSPGKVRSESRSSSVFTLSPTHVATETDNPSVTHPHTRAQEALETLPDHVLRHAKTFHTYIQLFVDDGNLRTRRGKGMAGAGMAEINSTLRKLLDEIAILGGIGNATKEEILQDPDARHVSTLQALLISISIHFVLP